MDDAPAPTDDLLQRAADRFAGHQRRLFQAEVAVALCGGSARRAERRFGWGRDAVGTGLHELASGIRCVENFPARGRVRTEDADLPAERTMRDVLNRMGYRLARVRKGRPLKKTADTDAIFANVVAVRAAAAADPATLEVSVDTKAKVAEGAYVRGGKNPDGG